MVDAHIGKLRKDSQHVAPHEGAGIGGYPAARAFATAEEKPPVAESRK